MFDHWSFHKNLLTWWRENRREFPWRKTQDPYHILISEVLLHRTRADQVVPVYARFVKMFPSVDRLALASDEQIENILRPLGLHWRSKLIKGMAQEIVSRYHGEIVPDVQKLKALPGISDYIASAVVCFAFGLPEVLLDTNTVRVLGRIFGMKTSDASRRSKRFKELYRSIIDKQFPREFNYAMIDLGALLCIPKKPRCTECPIVNICKYGISRESR